MPRKIGVNIKNVVTLLGKHLYTTHDIILRELIQNAYDAILSRFGSEAPKKGRIDVMANASRRSLQVRDNGSGMNEAELDEYLSTLAQGIKQVEKSLHRSEGSTHKTDPTRYIGEYGIGFYSSFLISDEITVVTRKETEPLAFRWTSCGLDEYEIDTQDEDRVGTEVTLVLQSGSRNYASQLSVRQIIQRYCNYLDCPIYLGSDSSPLNVSVLPWELSTDEEREEWLTRHYKGRPRYFTVGNTTIGGISFGYALSCGQVTGERHEIFKQRMFVSDGIEILPSHLRFVSAVVNCDSIELNLAREDVMHDRAFQVFLKGFEDVVLSWLKQLVRNNLKDKNLVGIIKQQQGTFRRLSLEDSRLFDKLYPYLLFELAGGKERITVAEYLSRGLPGDGRVLSMPVAEDNESADKQERLLLLICQEREIPVIAVEDEDDESLLRRTCNKLGVRKVRLNEAVDLLTSPAKVVPRALERVKQSIAELIGVPCEVTSFSPPTLPIAFDGDRVLLNSHSRLLAKLARFSLSVERERPLYASLIRIARSLDRSNIDKGALEDVLKHLVTTLEQWGDDLVRWREDEGHLRVLNDSWWVGPVSISDTARRRIPITRGGRSYPWYCFVILPFAEMYKDVLNIVVETCAQRDIYAEAAEEIDTREILAKVCRMIDACDFVIVDTTHNNPNVLFELGLAMARRKPAIILRNHSKELNEGMKVPTDIIGIERIEYRNTTEDLRNKLQAVCKRITRERNAEEPKSETERSE